MDLTTLWQEHKTFILCLVAGLLIFFVGQTLISSVYQIDEKRLQRTKIKNALRKRTNPSSGQLDEARRLNEDLDARYQAVVDRVNFKPDAKYELSPQEKPDIEYDRVFSEARDLYVEAAKTLNITVDGNLGMPELSPTRRSEIQRALTALDIVTRVVLLAMETDVRLGTVGSVADFLRRFALMENFMALDEAEFKMVDKDGASIRASFRVSSLTVIQEESES